MIYLYFIDLKFINSNIVTAMNDQTVIFIDFEGEEKEFTLKQDNETEILLNYDRMKKRILQTYKYYATGKDSIQLSVENFYQKVAKVSIPIHVSANYTYLLADMVSRGIKKIMLKVKVTGELTKRRQREKVVEVQFDSEGSVQSAVNDVIKTALLQNKPKKEPYRGLNVVRCLFCHHSSRQIEQKKRSGAFYGPFKDNRYAHLMCLLWCSDVYLNDQSKLCGVQKAINHTKNVKCSICNQKGASFYCHNNSCKIAGHYRCAQDNKWYFNWVNYTSYCPECSQEQPNITNSITSVPYILLSQQLPELKIQENLKPQQDSHDS